ncbi:MAG: competence/damage-inducible protein A [Candidatus Sumerlaeia bacterium]
MRKKAPTAVLCIIGNEILCGHTIDTNGSYMARRLHEIGVDVERIMVLPDRLDVIVEFLKIWLHRCDYIFTSGGIGPTHDDVTREAVARALGLELKPHPDAEKALQDFYGKKINPARLSMALAPEGCELIENPVSAAPGFVAGNIFVLAGVPHIFEIMFESVAPRLNGMPRTVVEIDTRAEEGRFAHWLADLEKLHPEVDVGSYPKLGDKRRKSVIRLSSSHPECIVEIEKEIREFLPKVED